MPKQNRVNPWGEIIATPARGTLMGNRGRLHDDQQQILRPYQGKRWISCVLHFKDRHRTVMAPRQYTELFFLDEVTALAAGHRPCAECSRQRFESFRLLWAQANPRLAQGKKPLADELDEVLHRERLNTDLQKMTYHDNLGDLPGGTIVALQGKQPYLWFRNSLWAWHPLGYGKPLAAQANQRVEVLTPKSIVRTLRLGYEAIIHPSAHATAPA